MNKLTLKDIVASTATNLNETKASTEAVLKEAFRIIAENVSAGDEVRIHEFGTFKLKERPARKGRNPATGDEIDIPASTSLSFKPVKRGK